MTRLLFLVSSVLLFAPGCSQAMVCGDGTHGESDQCLASLSPECGPGTKLVEGACVPDSGGGAVCGQGTHTLNGTCVPDVDLSGNASRFYTADLTDPEEFIPIANGPFHDSFVTGENLVFIGTYTPSLSILRLYGGGGKLNADGTYTLDHAKSYDTPAEVINGVMQSSPFTFQLKAFGSPEAIVLVDTVISQATMGAPQGITLVQSGKLSGVLTPENAQRVYIQDANQSLFELMGALEIPPDTDHDGNGVKESWVMGLTFTTKPVWVF